MWTELTVVVLSVLHCTVSSSLPKPINVSFSSVNLRNVLHWFPGNGTPDGTHFAVEYAIYGDNTEVTKGKRERWRGVYQCTNIVRTWCDLSAETWDEEEGYYARVRALGRKASSKWTVTKRRFDPKWDTILGPPLVSVKIKNNSAVITLTGPMRYSPDNDTAPLSMKAIYSRILYNLSIYNDHRNQTYHFPVETSPYKYQLLDYNTEYCFSAKSRFLSIPVQCKSSAWHCIVTPQDPVIEQLQQVVVGIVVPSLCICLIVLVSYPLYNYLTGKGQKTPITLIRPSFHPISLVVLPVNENLQQTKIFAAKPPPSYEMKSVNPHPQNEFFPEVPDIPQEPEDTINDLSVDYSSLKVVRVEETRLMKHKKVDAGNNLTGGHLDDHSVGGYKPQAQKLQQSPAQTEINTLLQTRPWPCGNPALESQTKVLLQSNQRKVRDEQTMLNKVESSALCFNKNPQNGTFNVHLNLPSLKEEEKREELKGGEQKQNQWESIPLLSGYFPQNISTVPTVCSQEASDCLSDDYGTLVSAQKSEISQKLKTGNDDLEMEKGARCSNWNTESINLVYPWMKISLNQEERQPSGKGTEDTGNCEETYVTRSQMKLENVILRQSSNEEAQLEEETELEADSLFSKWNLVIS